MREIERVLKPAGIAIITTEYILNDKEHPEFFNKKTIYSDLIDSRQTKTGGAFRFENNNKYSR